MVTDEDRRALTDLALRTLDELDERWAGSAQLVTAVLVFEARLPDDPDDPDDYTTHVSYKSIRGASPNHVGGLCQSLANWLLGNSDSPAD